MLPGEAFRVPVYFAGMETNDGQLELEIVVREAGDPTPIDWSSLHDSLKPSWMTDEVWEAVFTNLVDQIGPTWADYLARLSDSASYLRQLGLHVTDVTELYNFEFQQALALTNVSTLAPTLDISLPAPGLPLTFARSFGNTISERYRSGPFGFGWTAPWQVSLEVLDDGTVVVSESADAERRFQPDRRRAGTFFMHRTIRESYGNWQTNPMS